MEIAGHDPHARGAGEDAAVRELSLFAGIGGFDLGLERAGWSCAGQVELDRFCTRVLERRWPGVRRAGDVSTCFTAAMSGLTGNDGGGRTDLLTGGFPCQDLSVAGKRAGLQGERSGLFWEIVRIQKILQAPWGLFENVPGLLSSHHGRDMWTVLHGLRECWPAVGWRILDSQHFGVPQRRRRLFFVCGPTEAGVAQILFELEGGTGHPEKGTEAGAGVAASVAVGINASGLRGRQPGSAATFIANSLTGGSHGAGVNEPGRRAEDDVNLVMGTLREHPWPGSNTDYCVSALLHLGSGGPNDNEAQGGHLVVAPITATYAKGADRGGKDRGSLPAGHLVTHPLKAEGHDASEDGTGRGVPLYYSHDRNQDRIYGTDGPSPAHTANDSNRARNIFHQGVRRLTPVECERLQGFPDGWTCLCQPLEAYAEHPDEAAVRCKCPDSPRYRALGNAVTVNVVEWLGNRLMQNLDWTQR